MSSLLVKSVFSEGYVNVSEDETISNCLPVFKKTNSTVLIVLDSKGIYKGVLAQRWITRSRFDPSITKVKMLMRSAPKVRPDDSINKVSKLMIESGIMQLPVFENENLIGFVSDENIIHGAVMEKWGNAKVEEIMTKDLFIIEENESIGAVLSLFREQDISHIPVINNGKLVGIISIRDIIDHIFKPKQSQTLGEGSGERVSALSVPVKGVMTKPVITILPETSLKDAEKKMHDFDISSLIIVRKGRPIGIITKRDFLESISQKEIEVKRIITQFSIKDVKIDEIQKSFIMEDFESFTKRFKNFLQKGVLFVYMKTHGSNNRGKKLIHCRLQLRTNKGSFFSSSEGWDIGEIFNIALDRLERKIIKSKEIVYDSSYIEKYLQRIDFPIREL